MRYADVAVAAPTPQSFTYEIPAEMTSRVGPGMRVAVPFRRRSVVGYVLALKNRVPAVLEGKDIRSIENVLDDEPVFSSVMLKWLTWMSCYYCAPIGEVCRSALPTRLNNINPPIASKGVSMEPVSWP